MTRFTEFEKTMVSRAETPARPVAGFARIAAFGGALVAHFQHAAIRQKVARELGELSDRMLADIGLTRGDVTHVAALTADQTVRTERPLHAELGSFLYDVAVRPVVRVVRRHRAYESLMALDDRMLRDIGITRDEIPTLVKRLSGDRPDWAAAEVPSFRLWNRYRATARELGQLDNQTLADIGFVRGDIDWVAEELAVRSLNTAANANSRTPRAA